MSYEFRDLTKLSYGTIDDLPSESFIFNGRILDEYLEGYRTISVEGREQVKRNLNTITLNGDGEYLIDSRYPERDMVVKFWLDGKDTDEFNERWHKLVGALQGTKVPFQFLDEREITRYGTVTDINNEEPGRLNIQGSITIHMSDPWAYYPEQKLTGAEIVLNDSKIANDGFVPNAIAFTVTGAGTFKVEALQSATNARIVGVDFTKSYPTGSKIYVDFKSGKVYLNGNKDITSDLALSSTLSNFRVHNLDKIVATPNVVSDLSMAYNRRII